MNLRELRTDDGAVSPVIGVILMVAITVILAAVIASFVLGLGDQATESQPQASFGFEYDPTADSDGGEGVLAVTHTGGDPIEAQELYLRGDGFLSGTDTSASFDSSDSTWDAGSFSSSDQVSAGEDIEAGVEDDFEIDVVWEPVEGDRSAILADYTGPDA